jgi:hypothetical protein
MIVKTYQCDLCSNANTDSGITIVYKIAYKAENGSCGIYAIQSSSQGLDDIKVTPDTMTKHICTLCCKTIFATHNGALINED